MPLLAYEESTWLRDCKIYRWNWRNTTSQPRLSSDVVVTGVGLSNTADQLTNAIFGALDVNKDGKLSKEELLAADKLLMKFDDNDDEILTPQEILATAVNPFASPGATGGGLPA